MTEPPADAVCLECHEDPATELMPEGLHSDGTPVESWVCARCHDRLAYIELLKSKLTGRQPTVPIPHHDGPDNDWCNHGGRHCACDEAADRW